VEYCENCHDKHKWNNGTTENFNAHRIHTTARVTHTASTGIDTPGTLNVRGYAPHLNIGTSMRGTAILARNEITLTNIIKVPSGRAMATTYNGLLIINVYAASGTARRTDRESFYTSELTCVLQAASHNVILGGDLNCVLHLVDTTGPFLTSRTLMEIVRGLTLANTWTQDPLRLNYTHYSPNGATSIDRTYTSHTLLERKKRGRDHTRGIYRPPCCRAPPPHK